MNTIANTKAYRASILHFIGNPGSNLEPENTEYFDDGILLVQDGKVVEVGQAAKILDLLGNQIEVNDLTGKLIIPGMIDTHVHYPQTNVIGAYGEQLLEWLNTYTFPEEQTFENKEVASESANFFVDELLRNGTTTALVFGSVHPESVDAFFEVALNRKLRMICGKVMMDRNCPEYLQDTADSSYSQSKILIEKWHLKERLHYAVTPRFAPTSSPEQLNQAARLLREYTGLYMHTHVAENLEEVSWVQELFPDSRSYLDVYHDHNLLGERAVLAHCLHFDERDKRRMKDTGSACSFCATSNLFLGSGLFDLQDIWQHDILVGIGTDIGGGTSFNLLRTLHESYKVTQLLGKTMSAYEALYLATLGGAKALYLDDKIGNFEKGKEADFVVLNYDSTPLIRRRLKKCKTTHERLFCLLTLGDDRSISATHVLGEEAYHLR